MGERGGGESFGGGRGETDMTRFPWLGFILWTGSFIFLSVDGV